MKGAKLWYYDKTTTALIVSLHPPDCSSLVYILFCYHQADPWICGHRGHATTSCGFRFSEYFKLANEAGCPDCNGCIFWDTTLKKSKH